MSKLPAILLYVGDWMKDPSLSMCSPATRGIWIDLMCAMHENNRTGIVTGNYAQLSRLARCTAPEMENAISEISSTKAGDVTICNGNVTVINRRMKREYKERQLANKRVYKHRKKKSSGESNGDVTPQKRDSNAGSSSSSSITKEIPPVVPRGEYGNVFLTDKQIERLKSRYSVGTVAKYIEIVDGHIQSKGVKYKDFEATIRNFMRRDGIEPSDQTKEPDKPASKKPTCDIAAYRAHCLETLATANEGFDKQIKKPLREDINESSWSTFIEPMFVVASSSAAATVFHPDRQLAFVVRDTYLARINGYAQGVIDITTDVPDEFMREI